MKNTTPLRLTSDHPFLRSKLLVPLHEARIWICEREICIEIPEIWWCVSVCDIHVVEVIVP